MLEYLPGVIIRSIRKPADILDDGRLPRGKRIDVTERGVVAECGKRMTACGERGTCGGRGVTRISYRMYLELDIVQELIARLRRREARRGCRGIR